MTDRLANINKKQQHLDFTVEDFPLLKTCKKNIEPFEEFWKTYAALEKKNDIWNNTPVDQLDPDEIGSDFKKLKGIMSRLEMTFQTMRIKRLEQQAKFKKESLLKFQKKIPVIRALTTKGLKESHIAKMAKKIGLSEKTDITKQPLNAMENAEQHIQYLEQEADFAFRQYTMFNQMNDMKDAWKPQNFDTVEWKGVSYILTGEAVEQISEKLDEHIIKTQSMRGSPFIEPFKDELFAWEDTLMTTQENLEIWL